MRGRLAGLFFVIFSGLLLFVVLAKAEEIKYQEKKQLVRKLVDEAVYLIATKGQDALGAIGDKNGRFNTKDAYVFVTSGETGADLINPAFREVEGLPAKDYVDPDAKAAQETIVNAVKDKDTAWVEYLWPRPDETKPSRKVSYVRKIIINGKVRIVGAGFYPGE